MASDPVIVPPTPTITQPSAIDTSPGLEQVQAAFDKVLPAIKTKPTEKEPPKTNATSEPPVAAPEQPPVDLPKEPPSERDVPSFLEEALRGDKPSTDATVKPPTEDDWPEELPSFKTPEESKARYKKWRETYNKLKKDLTALQEKPTLNAQQLQKMEMLEGQNRQMQEMLSRVGVEQSAEFQQTIIAPLQRAWNDATRIVKDAGGNPEDLRAAMLQSGRAQFEALDNLFSDMPESAKAEAHDALRTYRRYEEARQAAVRNAPQAFEGIRKRELERQIQDLTRQKEDMKSIFERQVKFLRDDAKMELLLKTDSQDGKWWNEQGEKIIEQGGNLFLENTDMERIARACLLAPSADAYRKLWLTSQKKIGQLQKIIKEKIGNEPTLSESSGSQSIPTSEGQLKDDLKRPFNEVFLREFHRARSRNH